MKRFAAISLVPLLLFNTLGYYLVFYGDLLSAKHEAEVFIWGHGNSEKMVTLTFPLQDGKAVAETLVFTDDDEFSYQGRMYDISGSSILGSQIIYRCYTDTRETALNDDLCNKVNSDQSPAQNHKNNVLKEFTKDYTLQKAEVFFILPESSEPFVIALGAMLQSSVYRTVLSPPPEFLA